MTMMMKYYSAGATGTTSRHLSTSASHFLAEWFVQRAHRALLGKISLYVVAFLLQGMLYLTGAERDKLHARHSNVLYRYLLAPTLPMELPWPRLFSD
jgi:hypothetical protein